MCRHKSDGSKFKKADINPFYVSVKKESIGCVGTRLEKHKSSLRSDFTLGLQR